MGVWVLQAFFELFRGHFGEATGNEAGWDAIDEILEGAAEVKEFLGRDGFGLWRLCCGFAVVGGCVLEFGHWWCLLQSFSESSEEFDVDIRSSRLLFWKGEEPLGLVWRFLGTAGCSRAGRAADAARQQDA